MFCKPDYCLGVGINYRSEIFQDIFQYLDKIDFIEVNTERFFVSQNNENLTHIINSIPVVLHGLTLSIGTSDQDTSLSYFRNLSRTIEKTDCKWFSEHIAVTNVNGIEIRSLMPVEFTQERVDEIVRKTKEIMNVSKKPFLLENITYYYSMPTSNMTELSFIKKIVEDANCGILLDLNNLYVNSINHKYDPYEFLNQLPLERVVEVHLAGCDYIHEMLVDTHASSVRKEVLSLFQYLCKKTQINGVVIERDAKLNNFSDLINEVEIVRNILNKNKFFNN